MKLVIDAQVFKEDQPAVALTGNHYAPHFRSHG